MMGITHCHFQAFIRLISSRVTLYTPMIMARAIIHGHELERQGTPRHPLVLQLGGNEPEIMAQAADRAASTGFTHIDINAGCPSPRVQKGCFGAALMHEPDLLADCVHAIRARVPSMTVSVKTRLGVDHHDSLDFVLRLVDAVWGAGASGVTLHARKAWLAGLSPKQNRTIPPLVPERVLQIKNERPHIPLTVNGGITTLADAQDWLAKLEGVMMGRAVVSNPWLLAQADRLIFDAPTPMPRRADVLMAYLEDIARQPSRQTRGTMVVQPLHQLLHGTRGARAWRRCLADAAHGKALLNQQRTLIELAQQADTPTEPPAKAPSPQALTRPSSAPQLAGA